MEDNRFNLIAIVKIWLRWKKHIFIVCSITVVASTIVALMLPEYYKSTSIFYPYNPKLSDPRTLYVKDVNYNIFGQGEDLDRIISIANSSKIHRDMIREYDLFTHYNIDSTGETAMTLALEEFEGNFSIIRNDQGALEVSIYDKDKERAADMVKTIVGKMNYINLETIRKNNEKLLSIYQKHMNERQKEVQQLMDTLGQLREKYQLFTPLSKLSVSDVQHFKTNKGVDEIAAMEAQLEYVNNEYVTVKENYTQTKSTLDSYVQSMFIVEEAIPAEKKSRPIRWMIVATSLLVAFFLSTLYAVVIDFYRTDVKALLD